MESGTTGARTRGSSFDNQALQQSTEIRTVATTTVTTSSCSTRNYGDEVRQQLHSTGRLQLSDTASAPVNLDREHDYLQRQATTDFRRDFDIRCENQMDVQDDLRQPRFSQLRHQVSVTAAAATPTDNVRGTTDRFLPSIYTDHDYYQERHSNGSDNKHRRGPPGRRPPSPFRTLSPTFHNSKWDVPLYTPDRDVTNQHCQPAIQYWSGGRASADLRGAEALLLLNPSTLNSRYTGDRQTCSVSAIPASSSGARAVGGRTATDVYYSDHQRRCTSSSPEMTSTTPSVMDVGHRTPDTHRQVCQPHGIGTASCRFGSADRTSSTRD